MANETITMFKKVIKNQNTVINKLGKVLEKHRKALEEFMEKELK